MREHRREIVRNLAGMVPHWSQAHCDNRAAYLAAEHGETGFYTFALDYLRGGPHPLTVWTFDERNGDTFPPVRLTVQGDDRERIRQRAAELLLIGGHVATDDLPFVRVITYRPAMRVCDRFPMA
ncbi:hypothetical protein SH661x_001812 [Planctomicrobium sp. SH661]|uniref:hypothetical protein n=1 Tax=Planctomicrobium sp. SH661 TaxID=3448124 RepID=UPI003F5BFB5A